MPRYKCVATLPRCGKVQWFTENVPGQRAAVEAFRRQYRVADHEKRTGNPVDVVTTEIGGGGGVPNEPPVEPDLLAGLPKPPPQAVEAETQVEALASAAGPAPPTVEEPTAASAPTSTTAEPSDPTLSELGIFTDVADLTEAGLTTRSKLKAHYAEHKTFSNVRGIGPSGTAKIMDALKAWKQMHPEAD
jgi:hypothetical protein